MNAAATKFDEALRTWPPAGSGVHAHLMTAANLAAIGEIPPAEAEARILSTMPRPPCPLSEVAAAIRKAYAAHKPGEQYAPRKIAPPKPKPLPMTREAFIRRGDGAAEVDWWERSPIRIDWEPGPRDALAVLDALWSPGDVLFMGDTYGKEVATAREWRERIAAGEIVPPHIIPNPVRAEGGLTLEGSPSFRCDDAVASFRFAVAEFDGMSKADQLAFWWGYASAPIAALIDSGGKSIHAWLKVDAPSREAWEADIERGLFSRVLCPLGCDAACRNESRLSRMPGHYRREKNEWQRLLYLDPKGGAL